jgi:ABC-type branched-subunit amino acid transport system substrate-binding protein
MASMRFPAIRFPGCGEVVRRKEGKMKKVLVTIFLVVALIGVGFASCAVAKSDKSKEIIIGAAVDHTNFFSPWDVPAMRAIEFLIERKNEEGGISGRKLKLIKGDTKSDITLAPRVALDLIDRGAQMLLIT